MVIVRNVFRCKPGKAGELAERFRKMAAMRPGGAGSSRVLVDAVASFWTVVFELEAESLAAYEQMLADRAASPEMRDVMGNYMELVEEGEREVWTVVG